MVTRDDMVTHSNNSLLFLLTSISAYSYLQVYIIMMHLLNWFLLQIWKLHWI